MHEPNKNKEYLTIKEASKYLRVSKDTLRRWEKKKILKPFRSPTGWRYYSKRQLDYVFIQKPDFSEPTSTVHDKPKELPIKKFPENKIFTESILPPQALHKTNSTISRIPILFLAFFVSLNLMLLIFYFVKNLTGN